MDFIRIEFCFSYFTLMKIDKRCLKRVRKMFSSEQNEVPTVAQAKLHIVTFEQVTKTVPVPMRASGRQGRRHLGVK